MAKIQSKKQAREIIRQRKEKEHKKEMRRRIKEIKKRKQEEKEEREAEERDALESLMHDLNKCYFSNLSDEPKNIIYSFLAKLYDETKGIAIRSSDDLMKMVNQELKKLNHLKEFAYGFKMKEITLDSKGIQMIHALQKIGGWVFAESIPGYSGKPSTLIFIKNMTKRLTDED